MKTYSYILLTSQKFCIKIYISPSTLNNGGCIKISGIGIDQKPNYSCSKFSEPFTKLQICSVKGSEHFQRLYLVFCLKPSIQNLESIREGVNIAHKNFGPQLAPNDLSIVMTLYLVHLQGGIILKLVVFTSLKKRVQTSASKKILRIKKGT